MYRVQVFDNLVDYEEFLNDREDNIEIISVNITNTIMNGFNTNIYLTYKIK